MSKVKRYREAGRLYVVRQVTWGGVVVGYEVETGGRREVVVAGLPKEALKKVMRKQKEAR